MGDMEDIKKERIRVKELGGMQQVIWPMAMENQRCGRSNKRSAAFLIFMPNRLLLQNSNILFSVHIFIFIFILLEINSDIFCYDKDKELVCSAVFAAFLIGLSSKSLLQFSDVLENPSTITNFRLVSIRHIDFWGLDSWEQSFRGFSKRIPSKLKFFDSIAKSS
jgi:hypothetical protein